MNSFKSILALIFLLLSSSVYAKEEIKAFFYTTNSVFMDHVKTTLSKMAKQRNYTISFFDGDGDPKKQYDQLRNHISIGDLVVISISEEEYLEKMLKAAREHDARVVLFGSSPSANIAKYYDKAWYVGFEIFDSARKQFSLISKYLSRFPRYDKNANGFLDVVFLQGRENEFSTHVRTQVIVESFEKYGIKVNPLSYNYDDYSYSLAYDDFNEQLRKHGIENIEMVISNNDSMALGAIKALNERKYNRPHSFFNGHRHIPVFGVDGITDALRSVDAGMMTGTVIADYSALSRVIMMIFQNANSEDFQKIVWYKTEERTIFIPYREFSKIKVYNAHSHKRQHLYEFYMRRVFQLLLSILLIFQIQCVIASDDLYSFYYSGESEFINRFNASLKSYAKAKDIDLEMFDAKNNSSVQLNQIYSSVSSKDPLIINLVDTEQAPEIIYHAKSYRNRIVFFNRKPSDDVFKKYDRVWYVGTNSAAAGKYQAELISDYIELTKNVDRNRNGVLDIIILQGEKNHSDTTGRTSEILKQLSDKKVKYKVLSQNFDDWDTQTAFNDVKTLSSKVGLKNIDMIIANNDAMAVGAVDYLNTQGYNLGADSKNKYIPVFGVDGIPDAIEYIRQKKMTGTVFADFSALAKASVDIALEDSLDDEVLTRKIWYKITDRQVLIPFVKYSSFKSYFKKSRQSLFEKSCW